MEFRNLKWRFFPLLCKKVVFLLQMIDEAANPTQNDRKLEIDFVFFSTLLATYVLIAREIYFEYTVYLISRHQLS